MMIVWVGRWRNKIKEKEKVMTVWVVNHYVNYEDAKKAYR